MDIHILNNNNEHHIILGKETFCIQNAYGIFLSFEKHIEHDNYKATYKIYRKMPEISSLDLELIEDLQQKKINYHDLPEEHKLAISDYMTYMEGDIYIEKPFSLSKEQICDTFSHIRYMYNDKKLHKGWSIMIDMPHSVQQQLEILNQEQSLIINQNYGIRKHNQQQMAQLHILKLLKKIIRQYNVQEQYKINCIEHDKIL